MCIYTLVHGHIHRIFINLLAPTPAETLIEKEPHNRKELHTGHLQKCGYIILNIRSMFRINVLRKNVSIYMKVSHSNERKRET